VTEERSIRLEKLRSLRQSVFNTNAGGSAGAGAGAGAVGVAGVGAGVGGIDRDDPILAWASLHQAAGLRETE
jgi:hypothetical protein